MSSGNRPDVSPEPDPIPEPACIPARAPAAHLPLTAPPRPPAQPQIHTSPGAAKSNPSSGPANKTHAAGAHKVPAEDARHGSRPSAAAAKPSSTPAGHAGGKVASENRALSRSPRSPPAAARQKPARSSPKGKQRAVPVASSAAAKSHRGVKEQACATLPRGSRKVWSHTAALIWI